MLKPPYPQAEASTSTDKNINNSVQEEPKKVQVQTASATEKKPQVQAPKQEVPKPVPKQVVTHPVGCENYRNLVAQYNWNVDVALQVMRAESSCNPLAVGDTHLTYVQNGTTYGMSCGMFQVRYLPGRPSCSQMQDPSQNIAYAYGLYEARGWQPWTVCNKGIVSCY